MTVVKHPKNKSELSDRQSVTASKDTSATDASEPESDVSNVSVTERCFPDNEGQASSCSSTNSVGNVDNPASTGVTKIGLESMENEAIDGLEIEENGTVGISDVDIFQLAA